MFNDLDDETLDAAVNWSMFSIDRRAARRSTSSASTTSIARATSSRAASASSRSSLTKDGAGRCSTTSLHARGALHRRPTSARRSASTRRRARSTPTTATRRRPPATAWSTSRSSARTRLIAGARVERFDQEVNTFDPFGLFVRTHRRRTTRTPTCSRPSTSSRRLRANQNLRLSYSTTVNRPEFRELAAFEFTDVVGSRAVRGNPESEARADSERRRAAGRCSAAAAASSRPACSTSTSTSRSSAWSSRGAQPIVTFQNADSRAELRHRARSRRTSSARTSS